MSPAVSHLIASAHASFASVITYAAAVMNPACFTGVHTESATNSRMVCSSSSTSSDSVPSPVLTASNSAILCRNSCLASVALYRAAVSAAVRRSAGVVTVLLDQLNTLLVPLRMPRPSRFAALTQHWVAQTGCLGFIDRIRTMSRAQCRDRLVVVVCLVWPVEPSVVPKEVPVK